MFDNKEAKYERLHSGLCDTISARTYNLLVGLSVFYEIVANFIISFLFKGFFTSISGVGTILFIIGYFICCLAGSFIARSNSNPLISFLGYNLIVVPIGILLSAVIPYTAIDLVIRALFLTVVIVAIMIVAATIYPTIFAKMGTALFLALIITIVVELISSIFGYRGTLIDNIVVLLFSLYIGYDWYVAQSYPKTVDNAIDSAIDIYLDVINIFIRILSILSKNKN